MDFNKSFTFAIADPSLRSLTFKVKVTARSSYLVCREASATKYSFRDGGRTRDAVHTDQPRPPINGSYVRYLVPGQFLTLARVLFTSHGPWRARPAGPGGLVSLPPLGPGVVTLVALGLTPHHPTARRETDFGGRNIGTVKIDEGQFITATVSPRILPAVLSDVIELHAPRWGAAYRREIVPAVGGSPTHDCLIRYQTKLGTYVTWAHHNIPNAERDTWAKTHPLAVRFQEAQQAAQSGIVMGISRRDANSLRREALERETKASGADLDD